MEPIENNSQEDNNNGSLGREVEEEVHSANTIINENVPNPHGIEENERHWPHIETDITPEEAEEGAKNYPGNQNIAGQISHAENIAGTSEEDI